MTDIFTLGIKADTRDIDRGKKSADKLADSLVKVDKRAQALRENINLAGKALVAFGVTASAALGVVLTSSSNAAREIENLARISGLSVEQFQQASFAARSFGIEQDKLADILKDVQDKVGDFLKTGGGPMIDFFEKVAPRIGVTAEQFKNLNGKDALQLYVSTLEKANLAQSEMVFFLEAIASDATLLQPLLADNGKEFERLEKRALDLGVVLDDLDFKNLNDLKTSLGELGDVANTTGNIISSTLAPFIVDLTNKFLDTTASANDLRDTILDIAEVGVNVAGVFANIVPVFEIVGKTIAAFVFSVDEGILTIKKIFDELFDFIVEDGIDSFKLFGLTVGKSVLEMSNNLVGGVELGINGVISLITSGINELIEKISPLAKRFDLEISKIESISISLPRLDSTVFDESINEIELSGTGLGLILSQGFDNIVSAWESVNDALLQPLPSDQFDAWFKNIEKAITAQRELQDEIVKTGNKNKDVVKDSSSDTIKLISNAKDITKGLISAFGENEKAAQALHKVNQVISIVEQAMILQKVFADTAATQTHIANSAAKATANATEAVTSAAAAPFPVGFAAATAMIGLMASVLGGFGGGGASAPSVSDKRQQSQGGGTLFGSEEKSQSIVDSQERFEDIAIDQLGELRGIKNSINGLSAGITKLAGSVIASGLDEFEGQLGRTSVIPQIDTLGLVGDVINFTLGGLFGSTTKKIIDQGIDFVAQSLGSILDDGVTQAQAFFDIQTKKKRFFGLSSSTRTRTETEEIDNALNEQIASIFSNIGDVVSESVVLLGLNTQQEVDEALRAFNVDIGKISFQDLTGEEIESELQAVFSQQADLITRSIAPSLSAFQQIGEGLFDTLTRVTQEQVIFNDTIASMGISLSELSAIMQIEVAQSIINFSGGLEEFTNATSEFVDGFFTEAEKTKLLGDSLADVFQDLNIPMTMTREGFRDLVESIDITTLAGQEMFAALLQISPAMDDFIDRLDDQQEAIRDVAGDAFEMLEDAVELERDRISEVLQGERDIFNEEMKRITGVRNALKETFKELTGELNDAKKAVNLAFAAEKTAIERASELRISSIQMEIDEAQKLHDQQITQIDLQRIATEDTISSLTNLSDSLRGFIGQTREQANVMLESALQAARGGDFEQAFNLGDLSALRVDSSQFGTAQERDIAQAITNFRVNELANLSDKQLTIEEMTLNAINAQEENEKARFDKQITNLENQITFERENAELQIELLQSQLNSLLGLNTNVLSVDNSIANLMIAQAAISDLDFENQMIALAQQEDLAIERLDQAEEAHQEQTDQLDLVINTGRTQINILFDVNTSVLSVKDAIKALQDSIASANESDRQIQLEAARNLETSANSLRRQERLVEQDVT